MIYNLLIRNSQNVGDDHASPLDYYSFDNAEKVDVSEMDNPSQFAGHTIIFGGGGLMHLPAPDYTNGIMEYMAQFDKMYAKHLIAWGVGHNVHQKNIFDSFKYPEELSRFDLVGTRDNLKEHPFEWVPCVSCIHKAFHHRYRAKQEVVIFEHKGTPLDLFEYPIVERMGAGETSLVEAVKFLASAKMILTNSYHGAYWGMLLNRKVIAVQPFSTRFAHIHKEVQFYGAEDLQYNFSYLAAKARSDKTFLNRCRKANDQFYNKVKALVG